jgi:hypothetical protein
MKIDISIRKLTAWNNLSCIDSNISKLFQIGFHFSLNGLDFGRIMHSNVSYKANLIRGIHNGYLIHPVRQFIFF